MNSVGLNSSSRSSLPAGRVVPWWWVGIAVVSLCAGMVCLAPAAHAVDRCVDPGRHEPLHKHDPGGRNRGRQR